jgi:hypothetical protein
MLCRVVADGERRRKVIALPDDFVAYLKDTGSVVLPEG